LISFGPTASIVPRPRPGRQAIQSFFEDKPHGEIAEQLQIPLGTVKSRSRLAVARLRTLLGDMS
jgi:RNA polymerase sigma-70 factor (ECF subfamily)